MTSFVSDYCLVNRAGESARQCHQIFPHHCWIPAFSILEYPEVNQISYLFGVGSTHNHRVHFECRELLAFDKIVEYFDFPRSYFTITTIFL
jgi:hypothetical protein